MYSTNADCSIDCFDVTFRSFVRFLHVFAQWFGVLNIGGGTGGRMGLGLPIFSGGPGPPLLNFKFCPNKFE